MVRALVLLGGVAVAGAFPSHLPAVRSWSHRLPSTARLASGSVNLAASVAQEKQSNVPVVADAPTLPTSKTEVVEHDLKGSSIVTNLETIADLGWRAPIAAIAATV